MASRRWIDLAMLTPGTSQDNIRGQFYRGNVNVGAGAREYSNGFVVDGVNNTWAEMGEPRQNFAMDAIQEFKVSTSTYKAELRLATGGLVGRHQVGDEPAARIGPAVLPRRLDYRQGVLPDHQAGLPAVPVRRNDRRADRQGQDPFLLRLRGHRRKPVLHGQRPRPVAAVRRHLQERADSLDLQRQDQPSDVAAQSLFFRYGAEDEYRPIIRPAAGSPRESFDFAVPRQSAVVGHTWVMSARALNDFGFQYAYAKYQVSPPYSHGDWEAGDFEARLPFCTPVYSYPSIVVGGCGNAQMGPEHRYQLKDDFSYLVQGLGRARTS